MRAMKVVVFGAAVLLALVVVLLLGRPVRAGEVTVTWTKPETNCDGSTLEDLQRYRVYAGQHVFTLDSMDATEYTATGLLPGTWWIGATAINSVNVESPLGGPVVKTILPTDFRVARGTVFTVVKRTNKMLLVAVGTVPDGTQCDATQSVNGHYVVPREAVTWLGSVRPDVVVAQCE